MFECYWKGFMREGEVEVAREKSVIVKGLGEDSKMGILVLSQGRDKFCFLTRGKKRMDADTGSSRKVDD